MSNPFYSLAPFIQEYIYMHEWESLHETQGKAIVDILENTNHLLISSGTASGKTEAVFFPILSKIYNQKVESIEVLYVAPLKALINDQFLRLNDLVDLCEKKVWRWHGDVSQTEKKRLLEHPSGILQITPESLEALLMRHTTEISNLFNKLQFIIIDEVHAFMGTDRGGQLLSQITKLEKWSKCNPRRIGLSATLGDCTNATKWLALGSNKSVNVIKDNSQRRIYLSVDYHQIWNIKDDNDENNEEYKEYYETIYKNCSSKKSIIFTNSRSDAEDVISQLRSIAEKRFEPDIFHVHHGSISKIFRLQAEDMMKNSKGPVVTSATLTLELGIDIGSLERVLQIGSPYSCSSFVQRLGRSGRKTGRPEMYFTSIEERDEGKSILDDIPWELLQTIAIIQLYVEDKWIEPIDEKTLPYSLLYQQTLSMLFSMGDLSPAKLASNVLNLPAFKNISQEDYREMLRYMIELEHIQKTEEGTLIIGLKAEGIVNYFTFYAIFPDNDEIVVSYKSQEIGSISSIPPEGVCILLAGRSWKVTDVDLEGKHVFVEPIKHSSEKLWKGGGGKIHTKIVNKMRSVLLNDTKYLYLTPEADKRLEEIRRLIRSSNILSSDLIELTEHSFLMFPWLGSKETNTLEVILKLNSVKEKLGITSIDRANPYAFIISSNLSFKEFKDLLSKVIVEINSLDNEIQEKNIPFIDKYDMFLPESLKKKQYIYNELALHSIKMYFKNSNLRA